VRRFKVGDAQSYFFCNDVLKVAKIIVDVPLMQTDKPYSYAIPEEFAGMLEAGMRVHVPFGQGNRLIQGIVVGFDEMMGDQEELKEIAEVLDFSPVLNQEQLWLADELRKSVFSYKISLLKAMLPSLLNSSYDKLLYPTELLNDEEHSAIFGQEDSLRFSDLDKKSQAKLMRLTQTGRIRLEYQATDKKHIKTEKWYQVNHTALQNHDFPRQAKKKQALKEVLLEQQDSQLLADLRENFSRDIINYFIKENLISIEDREISRSAAYFLKERQQQSLTLNDEQAAAVAAITQKIVQSHSQPVLLEGVTGSGKTEVYLQVIAEALAQGKAAIMLVPEISLTPQVTDRFISRFGDQVAILHSGLSDGEKYDEWRKVERGAAQVVVGARSAIFAPLTNIGAIIIDEEHESSYKQDSNPRYHAREVALLRAQYNQAVLVLGSATPSLESRARASRGVYDFQVLSKRANPLAQIPQVEVVDFRDYIGQHEASNFTPVLLEAIQDRLDKGEQTVLGVFQLCYVSGMWDR